MVFEVFIKPNERLKYLNRESIHKPTVFHAIPKGVFHRLASLTTFNDLNVNARVDKKYLIHSKAL